MPACESKGRLTRCYRSPVSADFQATAFPFAAVIAAGAAKEALLALAVDPGLKGVLIAGGRGVGKSLLARAFRSLTGETETFIEVPLGATEDRLLGGIDLQQTVLGGRRLMMDGLLQQAHGGFLCGDDINLLEDGLAQQIARALDTGVVTVEREGLSSREVSEFSVIGSYDTAEGEVFESLKESIGLHVEVTSQLSGQERAEILRRVSDFDGNPQAFCGRYEAETAQLRQRIDQARNLLPAVRIQLEDRRRLSSAALRLGVKGHRAEVFAARHARAHAALAGRTLVEDDDLRAAIGLVLLPRATSFPGEQPHAEQSVPEKATAEGQEVPGEAVDDLILEATGGDVPEGLLVPQRLNWPGRGGGRRGRACVTAKSRRGRYVRATASEGRPARIALEATLRAAAPFQFHRQMQSTAIRVTASDLRFKQFRQKTGVLIIFAVDASGSMAVNRIQQAKGAMLRLLREAYLHRDKVALISFRGHEANVLLPPSRSVARARRVVDALPVGGGTPVAAGLQAALELARRARRSETRQSLMVLLTDGRANVPNGHEAVWDELGRICQAVQSEGMTSVVIDTRHRHAVSGEAERLAQLLGGRYVQLPRPDPRAVYAEVARVAEDLRR